MTDKPPLKGLAALPAVGLLLQYGRFGLVGLTATGVHVAVFTALLELTDSAGWLANLPAFSLAVVVSYLGHFYWTFPGSDRGSFPRFVATAIFGLTLNTLAAFVIVDLLDLPYIWAIAVMVLVVPVLVFLLAKFWAFR